MLQKDLIECQRRFTDTEYDHGGVAYAKSAQICHMTERAAANPLYANLESIAVRTLNFVEFLLLKGQSVFHRNTSCPAKELFLFQKILMLLLD